VSITPRHPSRKAARVSRVIRGHGLLLPEHDKTLSMLEITHEPECRWLEGRGPCDCTPAYVLTVYGRGRVCVLPRKQSA
jgi:hypothetical protein